MATAVVTLIGNYAITKVTTKELQFDSKTVSFQKVKDMMGNGIFKTATGLPFRYKLKVGKNGEYNRELLIDRREKSKSLAWSSVVLAFENSKINVFS